MVEPILRTADVSLARNGQTLLSDVSFAVAPGSRVLIQGPSGAGKTSLFRVLGLLEPPSAGAVYVDGEDASGLSERARARVRRDTIGIVFQEFRLVPDLTARENAALPQEHADDRDDAWIDTLFEHLDIEGLAGKYPATLSGGEKQRVSIARALANRPAVVLADEPTGQLDPATADRVLDLLLSLQEETETALVVVSHDRAIADSFESVVLLEDGTIVAE